MPKLARFGERQHMINQVVGNVRLLDIPVIAVCGTVFIPKTWDPDPEMDLCLGCAETRIQMLQFEIEHLMDEQMSLIGQVDWFHRENGKNHAGTG